VPPARKAHQRLSKVAGARDTIAGFGRGKFSLLDLVDATLEITGRSALRDLVVDEGNWRDRNSLRALDDQVVRMLGSLGLNPVEPAKLNAGDAPRGRLAELRAARGKD
jgi:hypothetical protein